VTLAAATLLGVVFARSVVRPLRQLQETATALGHGDLEARTPVDDGPPEVRSLSAAFNDTASRLEQLVTARRPSWPTLHQLAHTADRLAPAARERA